MEFLIDFNKSGDDQHLIKLGGKQLFERGEFIGYFITLNTLEDLGTFEKKVKEVTGAYYSLLVSISDIDGNTIYLDR
jgi:hypothetical protein